MEVKSRCIALKTIKFKDKKSIATCLVRELGRMSFVVSSGASARSQRLRAILSPATIFEAVIDYRENRSLQAMKEVIALGGTSTSNPVKQTLLLFIADVLYTLLKDAPADPALFDYAEQYIRHIVGSKKGLANAHISFLVGLTKILGIEPDIGTYVPGAVFNMYAGGFQVGLGTGKGLLSSEDSRAIPALSRMNLRNMHLFKMNRENRSRALDLLVSYISIHFGTLSGLHSADVLHSLYD